MQEEHLQQEKGPPPYTRKDVDWWLKKWGRQAVVDGQEPLTRQDVERLIGVNGGTAVLLNLDGRNMSGVQLGWGINERAPLDTTRMKSLNLQGAHLLGTNLRNAHLASVNLSEANLMQANLQGANLYNCNLRRSNLMGADLREAILIQADCRGADLTLADLRGARLDEASMMGSLLLDARISADTNLEEVDWGSDYVSILEYQDFYPGMKGNQFEKACSTYRILKAWYQAHGYYDVAGEFYYREMVCRRKATFPGFRTYAFEH